MKPRIYKRGEFVYVCRFPDASVWRSTGFVMGHGYTPAQAYADWLNDGGKQ